MNKTLMELLKHFAPEFAENQMQEKSLIFENEKYQKVPNKYKMLIGIGVAASLGSDTCTQMWTNMAKQNGVSSEEIVEAMQIARYMKQATVNDTIANSLNYLLESK
jgi:alkylhydroperoxidase/carboxymuconolactone decarboxylase family protein YurZ